MLSATTKSEKAIFSIKVAVMGIGMLRTSVHVKYEVSISHYGKLITNIKFDHKQKKRMDKTHLSMRTLFNTPVQVKVQRRSFDHSTWIPHYCWDIIVARGVETLIKRKRRRSDPVLWQNPIYQQKIRKPKDNTQTPPKTSITQRLRTDLGRSVGVTSHPTGVVKPVYGYPTFPLTATAV